MAFAPVKTSFYSRRIILGATVGSAIVFFFIGVIFWGGFNTAMEATNELEFCISCHEMEHNVYKEYKPTIHYSNRTGVRATCSDCHVPDPWIHKMVRKVQASKEVLHKILGTVDTPEKFNEHRLTMAKRVWRAMKQTDSRECRNCHNLESMNPEFQKPRARKQHLNAMENGQTCIDCHKGIAHKDVRKLLSDEELEELEKPWPIYVREVPEMYREGMKRVEAKEAEQAAREKEESERLMKARIAQKQAEKERIDNAVATALEAYKAAQSAESSNGALPTMAAVSGSSGTNDAVDSGIDWITVAERTVGLLYPGETSMEWVLNGKYHGGARPFAKAGDSCTNCHDKEAVTMGEKMVTGAKAETKPIPGKRGGISVKVQATHKDGNLFMRFEWTDAGHTPVPFVDGGKMDPDNQVKLALMLGYIREQDQVEFSDRAGCWQTCHHDAREMPHAPGQPALDGATSLGLNLGNGVTKYLKESRTKIEIKGRRGKKLGGWDKVKSKADIDAALNAGQFMDLLRYKAGSGEVEDGYILEQRVMSGGQGFEATAKQEGGNWVVVLRRSLKSDKAGDISIEPGQLYSFGFAIHDDYSNGRFHHVSLGYRLALDNPEAEINVMGQ
jgi:nitrate/TMAO reductase-like tetraheme cytochrome c subunit